MDYLTDLVSTMHLHGALYARFEVCAPWAVRFAPGAGRARFGLVTRGNCWLMADAATAPLALRGGDCFLILDAASFALGDDPQTSPRSCAELMATSPDRRGNLIRFGGGGSPASLITGWFSFDATSGLPLTSLLPPVMQFQVDDERTSALQAALDLLALETAENRLGGELVIRSLADVLLVQAVRAHVASAIGPQHGLLAAMTDPRLSRAVHAMHSEITKPWTVERLAAISGMSRSAFALHFRRTIGQTPLGYLTQRRMHLAKRLLRGDAQPLSAIAHRVGYDTDSAFAKAFRRATGMAPGAYRRSTAPPAAAPHRPR